eukprot:TRINITY_DN17342_c0_g2_i1.p1 TRINITY_DN17342_c0_g2~~TRINITY_DN17342_c0_g2_i1.p1  ORF type:complete len:355 (-),score=16.30 TRINITY_DN17342_c0_g2_i1:156-1160(-)
MNHLWKNCNPLKECLALQVVQSLTQYQYLQLCRNGTLAYEKLTSDEQAAASNHKPVSGFMLHGLLGQGKNWRTFCSNLLARLKAENDRSYEISLLDLRNHGASSQVRGFHTPHNMHASAQDIQQLVEREFGGQYPQFLMGHSLGGKVCMEYVKQISEGEIEGNPPEQVWIFDSQPGPVDTEVTSEVQRVFQTLKGIHMPLTDRKWLDDHLTISGYSKRFVDWVGSNLVEESRGSNRFRWAFSLSGAAAMYHSYRSSSYWDTLANPPNDTTIHVVRAAQSDRWTPDMISKLDECSQVSQGRLKVHILENAGHWLHTDNPQGLLDLVCKEFRDKSV